MRIGTWNIENRIDARLNERVGILENQNAAIWVLTEVPSVFDLSRTHPHKCQSIPLRLNGRDASSWVTICSKFPILRALSVPEQRRMAAILVDAPRGQIAIAGVVLPWQQDRGDEVTDQPPLDWAEYRRVIRDELPLLLTTLREQAPGARRVVAGDFNTSLAEPYSYPWPPGSQPHERQEIIRMLAEAGLTCHTKEVLYPQPSRHGTLIDHICSDLVTKTEVRTWSGEDGGKPRLSDHPGIVVEFGESSGER